VIGGAVDVEHEHGENHRESGDDERARQIDHCRHAHGSSLSTDYDWTALGITHTSVAYPGFHFLGGRINLTTIIYLPGWELVALAVLSL